VYVVLTARSLNPSLFIVARGEEPGSEKKLRRAGADKVESPHQMGGQKMAQAIMRPTVVTFMELAMKEGVDWTMEEIAVGPASPLQGVLLADSGIRQNLNLILVAIKRANGEMLFNPSHETPILDGDTLIALGLRKNLDALEKMMR
ncbi:MAG: TrkA C-terminal domain-containing protein, partial [Chloroflexota bacterium]